MAIDLVCGKTVESIHWIRAGVVRWVFEGDPYYFCSLACRRTFTSDPTRFLASAVPSSGRLPIITASASSARLTAVPPEPTSAERLAVIDRPSSARLSVVPALPETAESEASDSEEARLESDSEPSE